MKAYLFDRSLHQISCYEDMFSLTQALCARNSLILNAGIPQWLDDKDTVRRGEIQS
jgi:hypothetical protein